MHTKTESYVHDYHELIPIRLFSLNLDLAICTICVAAKQQLKTDICFTYSDYCRAVEAVKF